MTRAAWAAAAGAMLAAGVGCYSPPQYGPAYGYPAAPAYPAAPGGSYIVPGQAAPGTLGAPTMMPGSGPTLAPPINGSDAPPFRTFDNGSSGPTPAGPAVPDSGYGDPMPGDFESPASPGAGSATPPDDGFQPPASGDGFGDSPFMEGTAAPRRLGVEQASTRPAPRPDYFEGLDQYQRSDRPAGPDRTITDSGVRPAAFERRPAANEDFGFDPVTTPPAAAPAGGADEEFGYEPTSYGWLRGVVDYDPQQRNWHVIYGLPPDPADRFGGSLTLAQNGQLNEFQDNDVVLLRGGVDPAAGRDALGKPFYRVSSAELLGRFE